MKLSGNTVLITGGVTGIGYAMAEAFLKAGSEVVVCGRREAKLREAQKKHPELHVKACDVASPSDCKALAEWAASRFDGLNVLVNNAGIQRDVDFTQGPGALPAVESTARRLQAGPHPGSVHRRRDEGPRGRPPRDRLRPVGGLDPRLARGSRRSLRTDEQPLVTVTREAG